MSFQQRRGAIVFALLTFPVMHFVAHQQSACLYACRARYFMACPSVCPSVCHTLVLYRSECTSSNSCHHGRGIILVVERYHHYKIPRATSSAGPLNTPRVDRSCDFRSISLFISQTVRDRPKVAEDH